MRHLENLCPVRTWDLGSTLFAQLECGIQDFHPAVPNISIDGIDHTENGRAAALLAGIKTVGYHLTTAELKRIRKY